MSTNTWQILENALHKSLAYHFPLQQKPRRSDIFSAETWTVRERKKGMKSNLGALDDAIDDVYFWLAWKAWCQSNDLRGERRELCLIISAIEAARGLVLLTFRDLAKQLRTSLACDKARYLDKVVIQASQYKGAEIFKALRPLRVGSAIRKRGMKALPYLIDAQGEVAFDEDARDRL